MVDGLAEHPERAVHVGFQHVGGAASRAADATAFPHRASMPPRCSRWTGPGCGAVEAHQWLLNCAIVPHINGFIPTTPPETQKQLDENYLGNLLRLMALKKRQTPRT
jgi:hypothetical protein